VVGLEMAETAPPLKKGKASAQKQDVQVQHFLLNYYPTPETRDMELSTEIITSAFNIEARRILTFRFDNIGHIALLTTKERYRPSFVRRELTAPKYNACDKQGAQIMGEHGLKIYTRSKRDRSEDSDRYSFLFDCVKKACIDDKISLRELLKWPKPKPSLPQATEPSDDDRLAIRAAYESLIREAAAQQAPVDGASAREAVDADDDEA
jgi:hypothetical protein